MAMITVPAEATRKRDRVLGGPGRLAWTTRSQRVTVGPAAAPSGRRPVTGRAPARPGPGADRGRPGPAPADAPTLGLEGPEHRPAGPGRGTGRPPPSPAPTRPRPRPGRGAASTSTTTGSSVWRSRSRDHQRPDVRGGRPVDRAPGVAGAGRAARPGARRLRRAPGAATRRRSRRVAASRRPGRAQAGRHVQRAGQGHLDLPRPPQQAERRARGQLDGHVLDDAPPVRGDGDHHRPVAPRRALGPGCGAHRDRAAGCGSARWPLRVSATGRPASASEGEAVQVTTARRAGNSGATSPVNRTAASRAPTAWTQPDPLEWATPAQARTATRLPTTGANQATGWTRRRSRRPPGSMAPRPLPTVGGARPHPTRRPCRRSGPPGRPARRPAPRGRRRRSGPPPRRQTPASDAGGGGGDPAPARRARRGVRALTSGGRAPRPGSGRPGPGRPRRCPRRSAGGPGRPRPRPGRPGG